MPDTFLAEGEYLALVLSKLDGAIRAARADLGSADASMLDAHREMWEAGRHIVRDLDDAAYLLSFNRVVDHHARSRGVAAQTLSDLERMRDAPYFARIDFLDEQDRETWRIYIGRHAFLGDDALDFYVYDWRSPIASMFYDFDLGPAAYDTPEGRRAGELTLKRQFRIQGGRLLAVYDTGALVQDELLDSILSGTSGRRLKVIAESIQREQNAAIRFLAPRNMLVTGPAGSGKTSVGMHHLAYRLYHGRGRLNSSDIAVVSANAAFNEYIADILPDLYEADVRRLVLADLLAPFAPKGWRVGTAFRQAEYLLTAPTDGERARWIAALSSRGFVEFLRGCVDTMPILVGDIRFQNNLIESADAFRAHLNDGEVYSHSAQMGRIEHHIGEVVDDWFVRNADAVRGGIEAAAERGALDVYTEAEFRAKADQLRMGTIAQCVASIREANALRPDAVLLRALRAYGLDEALIARLEARMERKTLLFEDFLALLCVMACLGALTPSPDIRCLMLDEAQDYGPMRHFLLRALFPRAVFILLADTRQALFPGACVAEAAEFGRLYPNTEAFALHRSYRSTAPISALAASFLPDGDAVSWYEREGGLPAVHAVDDLPARVAAILNRPFDGTTAVITRTSASAERLYAAIGKRADVALVSGEGDVVPPRAALIPLYLTKGLEFDRVILCDLRFFDETPAREANALYLMCSRALHELHIVVKGGVPDELARRADLWRQE